MFQNQPIRKGKFLFEWLFLNFFGWMIGVLSYVYIRQSNIEALYYQKFSIWQEILSWLPLGISISLFQWLKLKRFGINNIFIWAFVTAVGICLLPILSNMISSVLDNSNLISQGKLDLGEFIGKIDIHKNILILLNGMAILVVGLITSSLQATVIERVISKPWLWVKANMVGLLTLVVTMSLVYFFKRFVLSIIYFGDSLISSSSLYFIVDIAIFLLPFLATFGFSIIMALPTGNFLIKTINTESNS